MKNAEEDYDTTLNKCWSGPVGEMPRKTNEVSTSFLCLLCIITITISFLTKCSKQSSSDSDDSSKQVGQKASSASASSEKKNEGSSSVSQSGKAPGPSGAPAATKPSQAPNVKKQEDAKKNAEGQSVLKRLKKDEALTVQDNAVTNLIQAAKTTKLPPPTKKEKAPPSDPGDGNYEDVNLAQSVPDAPKRIVTVDPIAARFPTSGGKSTFTVLNTGGDRLVFKVKCSNNKDYRIKPVYGFLDPDGSHLVWVVRMPSTAKEDKMVIQWTVAPPNVVDGASIFKAAQPSSVHSINVPLIGVADAAGPGAVSQRTAPPAGASAMVRI